MSVTTPAMFVSSHPVISVIIPLYNSADIIERCLDSVFASRNVADLQVIVVDDASTDGSLELVKRYPVTVVKHSVNSGVSAARNTGANNAAASILFFCDTDVRLYPDTLARISDEFRNDADLQILNCGVSTVPLTPGMVGAYLGYKGGYDHWRLEQNGVRRIEISYVQTLSFAIRKDAFNEGQFDSSYQDPGGEEYELGHRLTGRFKLWLYPAIKVDHDTKTWQDRFKANFVRTSRWVPLFLKRGGKFETTTGVATAQRGYSTMLSTMAVLLILWGVWFPPALIAGAAVMAAKLPFVYGFFRLLAKEQGVGIAVRGFLFELPYESCFGLGFAWGVTQLIVEKVKRAATAPVRMLEQFRFFVAKTPPHLVWFCTSRCNQRCSHCFYNEKLNSGIQDLTLDEIKKIASSLGHVKYLSISGGEPSLREDLVECIEAFHQLNGLQQVCYHTNGMKPQTILKHMQELTLACPELVVICSVSIDHFEEMHDRQREAPGAFRKALETLELLKPLRENRNFDIYVNTLYSAANADCIMEIHHYVTDVLHVNHAVSLVRGAPRDTKLLDVGLENYKEVVKAIAQENFGSRYPFAMARQVLDDATKELVLSAVEQGRYVLPCTAGRKTIVLGESGDVYPCELLGRGFGNVREHAYDVPEMLRSVRGKKLLNEISEQKCFCSWECVQPNNLIFNLRGWRLLVKVLYSKIMYKK